MISSSEVSQQQGSLQIFETDVTPILHTRIKVLLTRHHCGTTQTSQAIKTRMTL
jgi:hypothetical protein